ncbi:MAG: hypothetical protein GTN67_09765 [Hydrotalea flava]|uniref:DUF5690 family protein n=1 Tax=Hydrotalea lipotrueae TaxID=2803817 RepID=UPI0016BA658B|nr:DUF5690 family protein [Hydrotalea lipotrueae]MBY0348680.1 hypothetical protein [Hydrotalea flava]GHU33944.1 hypothetical protein FACS1894166_10580 [Bacilli bacterium]NIM35635.1 hypothetical protein [Hydrotalea flava]NIM38494.1 hypothetical protein [Hydrotalea flava]NIN03646.1 hypothetical protein [Hydrotalea flava]
MVVNYIKKHREFFVALYAAVITFLTYATVYAFRKPFTAGTYHDMPAIFGLAYKDALVISQVLGYMFSKFYGIKFIAELKHFGRGKLILMLVGVSWLALLLFAIVPAPYNILFLFINGFPLGIIWGIVFSFVEGRKATDFIGAALAVSFIFSSGFVKSVGKTLMVQFHIKELWMPFVTGLVFAIPMIILLWLLEKIPPPTEADKAQRVIRASLNKAERKIFFKNFSTGLVLLVLVYVILTVFRDIRDNFAADMFREMGFGKNAAVFTETETPISIIVLILISSMIFIKNNARAFFITHYLIIAGFMIVGVSSWLFLYQHLPPLYWMTLVGLGLYVGYIPFNCILFDRMIATYRYMGNVGFLMYVADSFGYLGSVGVIILKTFFSGHMEWSVLYGNGVIIFSVIGVAVTAIALYYFKSKYNKINIVYA